MTAHKSIVGGTEYRTTVHDKDTIVLVPSYVPKSTYSGRDGNGLPADYFILDECGPFEVRRGMRLIIHRGDKGVFDAFEWMDI